LIVSKTLAGLPAVRRRRRDRVRELYLLRTDVRLAFAQRLAGQDMGKGCLRFRGPERVDFDLVRDLLRATAAEPGTVCGPL
jgi:hypothetical protein